MKRFAFDIDIAGSCNLRCPSCPQGNIRDYRLPQGYMTPELLEKIIRKANSECKVTAVGLFSWAEPLLNPRLPELISVVQKADISCFLSSNLNILRNADEIMAADPFSFRISASGFSQEVYGYSHRGGNIERVKKHMRELAAAKERNSASTRIYVYYHRYKHNLKEEPLMRQFAADLGIGFQPVWALLFPVEKILGYVGDELADLPLTEEDLALIDRLALPLREAMRMSQKHRNLACPLRDAQISMDFRGNVQLCCGIFHAGKFTLGNYLTMPVDEIQSLRQEHDMCARCMRSGVHIYVTYGIHELEELAVANVAPEDAAILDLRYELLQKRLRRSLEAFYQKVLVGVVTTEQKAALGDLFNRLQSMAGKAKRSFSGKSR